MLLGLSFFFSGKVLQVVRYSYFAQSHFPLTEIGHLLIGTVRNAELCHTKP